MTKLRGHEIYESQPGEFRYVDTNELTVDGWKHRPCGECGEGFTPEGHDPCLGTLDGVMNACCGHGAEAEAYIQFEDGGFLEATAARLYIEQETRRKQMTNESAKLGDVTDDGPALRENPFEKLPRGILICDFDGVFTDNTVYTDQNGVESVRTNKADSLGISMLQAANWEVFILSKETNPVVLKRAEKMGVECQQGIHNKAGAMRLLQRLGKESDHAEVYIGNDVNDIEAMELASVSVCPADAHPSVRAIADVVLSSSGGHGAVREVTDFLLAEEKRRAKALQVSNSPSEFYGHKGAIVRRWNESAKQTKTWAGIDPSLAPLDELYSSLVK